MNSKKQKMSSILDFTLYINTKTLLKYKKIMKIYWIVPKKMRISQNRVYDFQPYSWKVRAEYLKHMQKYTEILYYTVYIEILIK